MKRKRRRRQWHNQAGSPSHGRTAAAVLALIACPSIVSALAYDSPLWFVGVATGLLLCARIAGASWRFGIHTDGEGLVERYLNGRARAVRWDEITAVELTDSQATLRYPGGEVRLAPPLGNWALIATTAQRHLGGAGEVSRGEEEIALAEAQVAGWLGIGPDGALTMAEPRPLNAWVVVGVFLAIGAVAWARGSVPLAALALGAALAVPLCRVEIWLISRWAARRPEYCQVKQIRATPRALEVRSDAGWRSVSWGALLRRSGGPVWVTVTSLQGDLLVPIWLRGRRQLLHAIDEAIAARRAGLSLPRLTGDVPESALSRAELSVEAERGLSAAEGNEP